MLEYEMANPGQDGYTKNDPTKNPEKRQAILQEKRKQRPESRALDQYCVLKSVSSVHV